MSDFQKGLFVGCMFVAPLWALLALTVWLVIH